MRTSLITSLQVDQHIIDYASERGLRTYAAMNELIKLGLAYYHLFGKTGHKHAWIGHGDFYQCSCGAVEVKR